jgi:hypothetical protein
MRDGAAKPRQGQVHGGNTGGEVGDRGLPVLFTAGGALYADPIEMESAMRRILAALLVAMGGMLAGSAAQAGLDWVPPFKGNDTGGIIAYELARQVDARQLAVDHCASYGKVVKFLAVQPYYGGYVSFSCRWVPYGAADRPLRTLY